MNRAIADIVVERARQQTVKGWTVEHDDTHTAFELSRAAACYAWAASLPPEALSAPPSAWFDMVMMRRLWPDWPELWWKPKDPRRNLIRAAALIVAEIERLDRASVLEGANNAS